MIRVLFVIPALLLVLCSTADAALRIMIHNNTPQELIYETAEGDKLSIPAYQDVERYIIHEAPGDQIFVGRDASMPGLTLTSMPNLDIQECQMFGPAYGHGDALQGSDIHSTAPSYVCGLHAGVYMDTYFILWVNQEAGKVTAELDADIPFSSEQLSKQYYTLN